MPARMLASVDARPPRRFLSSLVLLVTLAACVCFLSLTLFFPGYLDPFAPYHIDHFSYIGLHHVGHGAVLRYLTAYPRPIGYILIHQCGRLGVHGLFAPLYLATFLNAALLSLYLARVTRRPLALPCFAMFVALVYANPEFYWNLKDDPFAVFSLTFLLGMAHCWQTYVDTGRRLFLVAAMALAVLFTQTKESYFCVLVVFVALQFVVAPGRVTATGLLLVVSVALIGFALHRASQVWLLFHERAGPHDVYYTSVAPLSVLHGLLTIGRGLLLPVVALALTGLLLVAWDRNRTVFWSTLALLACAVASLLPNATLPNHLQAEYAGLGLYFLYAPFLFVDRLVAPGRAARIRLCVTCVVLYGLVLLEHGTHMGAEAAWLRDQEIIARRLVTTMNDMRRQTLPGDSVLVAGMSMPFNPYRAPYFIRGEMGPTSHWTVIVGDGVPESAELTTRLVHASNPVALDDYDRLFVVGPDGRLMESVARPGAALVGRRLQELGMVSPPPRGPLRAEP